LYIVRNSVGTVKFKKIIAQVFILLFGLMFSQTMAQELPPIEIFTPKQYGGENQNWAISQSKKNLIYIANDEGLLEFNGANWKLYPSPNKTIMRSVHVVDERVYTGCYMEFGYWKSNNFGKLIYTSLSKDIQTSLIEDEQFWSIISLDNWVLFQSLNRIYIYNTNDSSFKIIESKTRLTEVFKVDGTIYFQKLNDGIYKIENGEGIKVSDHNIVKDNIVVNMFSFKNKLLFETQEAGFYMLENNMLTKWDISASGKLKDVSVYSCIQLHDKSFVLGTISHGVFLMTPEGEINYQIDQNTGLNNNTILSVFEDNDNNIWLGLDNGISCINVNSPFSIFYDEKGEIGTVYASAVHNENLYLGTNQGLFFRKLNSLDSLKFIEGTSGQVWSLELIDETLFCGHNIGTLIVNDDEIAIVDRTSGTWNIQSIEGRDNLLLQGKYDGLNILENKNGVWQFRNKIEGFNNASRFVEWYKEYEIFVSHEYKGVYRIMVDDDYMKVVKLVEEASVKKGLHSSLIKYLDEILYASKDGVFIYNESLQRFEKDLIYSSLFEQQIYTSGKLVKDNTSNKLWNFTNRRINYLSPGKLSEEPSIQAIGLSNSLRESKTGYENITFIGNQSYLFGTSFGFIIIDLNRLNRLNRQSREVTLNTITNNALNQTPSGVNKSVAGQFANKKNNIVFSYSVPEFDKYHIVEYQYQLDGIYNRWSDWSTNSSESFKNLPHGDYTFNVKARVGNKQTTNIASYNFSIDKPWHLTNTMLILYFLGVIVLVFLIHTAYKRYYKRQREKLLEITERELELKKLENEQQLMGFKNEKLQHDIDSKNRELAISTMSLINKNEFLNTIKKELNSVVDINNVKPVIKIIDKNLNNTDDWKLFQEAFNNADKDFLKKIKGFHSTLTPNDLRLCAYLRLNLSSKEIAPLLNISPRSVEVKRYRLRKKMCLPHESSLTNYILEI